MEQPSTEHRLDWYHNAKFGMFIHWGPYSVAGVEASWPIMAPKLSAAAFGNTHNISQKEYEALPARFNPVEFDPEAWVMQAQEAGMRYLIFTTKHHDGFCMFDAPGTDYKITNTPYGKDICLELAQACERHKLPLGFYYSPPDMHHPGYRDTLKPVTRNWTGEPKRKEWAEYLDYMESHLHKLLSDYGPIVTIWFDGLANHGKYQPERFHKLIHELSPNTLINDRLGNDFDFITPEQFIPKKGIPARTGKPNPSLDPGGDGFLKLMGSLANVPLVDLWLNKQLKKYGEGTLELTPVHQEPYPSPEHAQPWETCMTLGNSWAYNPLEKNWKDPQRLLRSLVSVVSRGGNYLLDVGPTPQGTFPPEAVERLKTIGTWMQTNSASIYGTTYTPLQGQPWGEATRKENTLYLHIFEWPTDGSLVVEHCPGKALGVSQITGEALTYTQSAERVAITLPAERPEGDLPVLAVSIDADEAGWKAYNAPLPATTDLKTYIKTNAKNSFIINAVANGLIAFCAYSAYRSFTYHQVAVDILEVTFIIAFLTAWVMVGAVRGEYNKGNLVRTPGKAPRGWLPKAAVIQAIILGLDIAIIFGGLLAGLAYLLGPNGWNNWVYAGFKTLYAGASGALAVVLTTLTVASRDRHKAQ